MIYVPLNYLVITILYPQKCFIDSPVALIQIKYLLRSQWPLPWSIGAPHPKPNERIIREHSNIWDVNPIISNPWRGRDWRLMESITVYLLHCRVADPDLTLKKIPNLDLTFKKIPDPDRTCKKISDLDLTSKRKYRIWI